MGPGAALGSFLNQPPNQPFLSPAPSLNFAARESQQQCSARIENNKTQKLTIGFSSFPEGFISLSVRFSFLFLLKFGCTTSKVVIVVIVVHK
jgi:hypothetical protein